MTFRGSKRRALVSLLVVVLLWPVATWAAADPPWQWDDVPRVVAFGDVHGAYDRLVEILTQAGIIDASQNWVGGDAHLVSVGDLVDRGPDSRKVLDLLMRLEREAGRAGGRVHLVLGNHEVMNLIGDLRYVSEEEYLAFADDELPADREQAWERYRKRHDVGDPDEDLRAAFDQAHPPGYFGLRAAFAPDGVYGRWLLERSVLVRIDGTAFVHAGLSRIAGQVDGEELNRWAMVQLREYLALVDRLEELGVLAPETGYADRTEVVRQAIEAPPETPPSTSDTASDDAWKDLGRRLLELSDQVLVFWSEGPLWYRGTASGAEETEQQVLDRALAALGAERVAIGHTPTPDGRIQTRLRGRALLIDAGMLEPVYGGRAAALIQEGQRIAAFYPAEEMTSELQVSTGVPEATVVTTPTPTDAEIEEFLRNAEVLDARVVGSGVTRSIRLTLAKDGVERRAAFVTVDTSADDVAAYRLDRMVGLGMVPVAVSRTIQGREGTLRLWVEEAIDDEERRALGLGRAHQEAIDHQMQDVFAFDALIYNEDRIADSLLLTPADWRIHLIDHTRAFRTKTQRPAAFRQVALSPAPDLARAIAGLDEEAVRTAMDGLLQPEQVKSILKRRKKLVREWTKLEILSEAAAGAGH